MIFNRDKSYKEKDRYCSEIYAKCWNIHSKTQFKSSIHAETVCASTKKELEELVNRALKTDHLYECYKAHFHFYFGNHEVQLFKDEKSEEFK